jgi:hypothetical protein
VMATPRLPVVVTDAGDPVAAAPVTGDRRILGLFREWAEAWRHCRAIEAHATGDEMSEARRLEDAVAETDAEGLLGLAV